MSVFGNISASSILIPPASNALSYQYDSNDCTACSTVVTYMNPPLARDLLAIYSFSFWSEHVCEVAFARVWSRAIGLEFFRLPDRPHLYFFIRPLKSKKSHVTKNEDLLVYSLWIR